MNYDRIFSFSVSFFLLLVIAILFLGLSRTPEIGLSELLCKISITLTFTIDFARIILSFLFRLKNPRRLLIKSLVAQIIISTGFLLAANIIKFSTPIAKISLNEYLYISANCIFISYLGMFVYMKLNRNWETKK